MTSRVSAAPRRLGRPKDVASAETHERLLSEARRAFARDGLDAATNREIAEAAGITAGAIYHYYPSKLELYVAVYEQVQHLVYDAFGVAVTAQVTIVDQLCAVLDAAVALNRRDPSIAGFVVGVASEAERHPELVQRLANAHSVSTRFARRLVDDATERDELALDVSARALEDLINAVLGGLARFSSQTGDAARHESAVGVLKRCMTGSLLR